VGCGGGWARLALCVCVCVCSCARVRVPSCARAGPFNDWSWPTARPSGLETAPPAATQQLRAPPPPATTALRARPLSTGLAAPAALLSIFLNPKPCPSTPNHPQKTGESPTREDGLHHAPVEGAARHVLPPVGLQALVGLPQVVPLKGEACRGSEVWGFGPGDGRGAGPRVGAVAQRHTD
jgi:hypothetical protein